MHDEHPHIDPYFKKLQEHSTPLPQDAWNQLQNRWFDKEMRAKLQHPPSPHNPQILPPWQPPQPSNSPKKGGTYTRKFLVIVLLATLTAGLFWFLLGPTQMGHHNPISAPTASPDSDPGLHFDPNNLTQDTSILHSALKKKRTSDKKDTRNASRSTNEEFTKRASFSESAVNGVSKQIAENAHKEWVHFVPLQPIFRHSFAGIVLPAYQDSLGEAHSDFIFGISQPPITPTLPPSDSVNLGQAKKQSGWSLQLQSGALIPHSHASTGSSVAAFNAGLSVAKHFHLGQLSLGIEYMPYTYNQDPITTRIWDSIPHLDPNGDTLGWFTRNERDTTVTGRYQSRFTAIQIPVSLSRSWQISPRLHVLTGVGLSANHIRSMGYYSTNSQGVTEWIAPGTSPSQTWLAGYRLECGFEYQVNAQWSVHMQNRWQGMSPMQDIHANRLVFNAFTFNFGLQYSFK